MKNAPRLIENPVLTDFLHVTWFLPEDEKQQVEAFSGTPYDPEKLAISLYTAPGPKWCLLTSDNEPIVVGGYIPIGVGKFESFMLVTELGWIDHGRAVTRQAIRVIGRMFHDYGARRLQTLGLADRALARSWYEKIGLHYESTLASFGAKGEDAVMYVRIKP
jgi:hypothetical protein